MKNKKKNKAQRQAGRRLCKNIKNGRNTSCGFINHKKETPIYASNMRVYISNASGQFTMDQHIDTTKLERLKEELSKKPGPTPTNNVEVKSTQTMPTTPPVKEKTNWWVIGGSILSGGLLGVFLATRKKSA